MLVDYDDTRLGPYSPVRLSALSSRTAYDAVPVVNGQNYKIWFSIPPQHPTVWTTTYQGKKTPQIYTERWNAKLSSGRFLITKVPSVDNANGVIYMEGKGLGDTTFGKLALDDAWARLTPWYAGGLFGWGFRGVEGVAYSKILDSSGRDVAAGNVVPGIPQGEIDDPGTSPGDSPLNNLTSGLPKIAGISVLWIGAAAAVVGGAILFARKKKS